MANTLTLSFKSCLDFLLDEYWSETQPNLFCWRDGEKTLKEQAEIKHKQLLSFCTKTTVCLNAAETILELVGTSESEKDIYALKNSMKSIKTVLFDISVNEEMLRLAFLEEKPNLEISAQENEQKNNSFHNNETVNQNTNIGNSSGGRRYKDPKRR